MIFIKKNYGYKAFMLNPLVLFLYYSLCSLLITYLDFGGTARRLPTIVTLFSALFLWFFLCLVFRKKITPLINFPKLIKFTPYYVSVALILLVSITIHTGIQIVELAQTFGTPIHWRLRQLETETRIDLGETNILETGLDSIFTSIDNDIPLPETLYLINPLELEFNRKGEVTSFHAHIFGEDDTGELNSFLISSRSGPNQLVVTEQETGTNREKDEEMLLSPLFETIKQVSLTDYIQQNPDEDRFGIYYMGYRSWGYNREGIYYIEDNHPIELQFAEDEIVGFTVSVYVSGKTDQIPPNRYIDRSFNAPIEHLKSEEITPIDLGYQVDEQNQDIFFLTEDTGFRLPVIDAATGSRWYGFEKTADGGENWETVNPDPFSGRSGRTTGLVFLDEDLGFASLERGSQGTLFRTEDGGLTFNAVDFPEVTVPLGNEEYNPFQFPERPYKEDNKLKVLVGQGAEGDYSMGAKALYESEDEGKTWYYIEEVSP